MIETVQTFYGKKKTTRITTHQGYRLIEYAYPDGKKEKFERFWKNHSKDCQCLK